MATSGSVDYSATALFIINEAFKKIGVKSQEQALEAPELDDGLNSLNLMVKGWQAQGLHLWTKEEGVVFLDQAVQKYALGATGAKACLADDFVSTSLSAAEASGQTTLSVTSTTGMAVGDSIGIKLDSGMRQWTTITTVDSTTQVTVAAALTGDSASGNSVFSFTSLIQRPLRILGARSAQFSSSNEYEVRPFSRFDYFNQPNKASTGQPVNYYYSPQLGNGDFYVWPTASSADYFMRITFERPVEDMDLSSDEPDFPIEWAEVLVWNLAARLAIDYGSPQVRQQLISVTANNLLDMALGFDTEDSTLDISPRIS